MESNSNPFFKLEDFQSLEVTVKGTNSTSQINIPGDIPLLQVYSDGVSVELPPKCCAMGHTLVLDISARRLAGTSKKILPSGEAVEETEYTESKLMITGVIEQMEGEPGGRQQVRLRFRQYGQKDWEDLLGYFSGKQTNINQLIKATRK